MKKYYVTVTAKKAFFVKADSESEAFQFAKEEEKTNKEFAWVDLEYNIFRIKKARSSTS